MESEIIILFALSIGVLDNLSPAAISKFKEDFIAVLQESQPEVFTELRNTQILNDVCIEKLYDSLGKYFQNI